MLAMMPTPRDVDDRPATGLAHRGYRRLGAEESSLEVDGERLIPFLLACLFSVRRSGTPALLTSTFSLSYRSTARATAASN